MPHLSLSSLALLLIAGLVGGMVRGYSGFGFALAAVPLLNLVFLPSQTIPSVLIIECLIGAFSLAGERAHVAWPALRWLITGAAIGTPLGVMFLTHAPADLTRIFVAAIVLVAIAIIWLSPRGNWLEHGMTIFSGGLFSGVLNGGTALSGPPAVLVLLGGSLPTRTARATLIVFILISAIFAVALTALAGLQGAATVSLAAAMLPSVIFGAATGVWLFKHLPERFYRATSLGVLLLIALITLASTIMPLVS